MTALGRARNLAVRMVLAIAVAAMLSSVAEGRSACDWSKARAFRAAGDRYNAQQRFASAARQYFAASRKTRSCQTSSGALLTARSLAQAGTALAQTGDLLSALALLHESQALLTWIEIRDRTTAPAARSYAELVRQVVSAIDSVAESSM